MQLGKGLSALWIAAACLAAYGVTLAGDFVYDDLWTVVHNAFITDPGNLTRLLSEALPPEQVPDATRPTAIALAVLDYRLWGLWAPGWHLQSLLWHLACALAVAALARALARDERLALAAGLVFGVHAVQAETVAAINYREDLVAAAAVVTALVLVLRARRSGRNGWIALACAVLVVGTNAKESAAIFPLLLATHDLCFHRGGWKSFGWRRAWPYLPLTLACLTSRFWVSLLTGAAPLAHVEGARGLEPLALVYTEAGITLAYLGQLLLPVGLSAEYATPIVERPTPAALAGLVAIAGLVTLALWCRRRQPVLAFGILWLLVGLLPTANIVPIENLRADRYLYLPSVGYALALAWLLVAAAQRLDRVARGRMRGRSFALLLLGVCLVYGSLAFQRSRVWRDDLILWQVTAAQVPGSPRASLGLMSAYQRAERWDEALAVGRDAAARAPGDWKVRLNLGLIHDALGRFELAVEQLRLAERLGGEGRAELEDALGAAHFHAGDTRSALAVLEPAAARHPADARLALSLGKVLLAAGHYRAGAESLERAARLRPRDAEPQALLARAWLRLARLEEARRAALRAVELEPSDPRNRALLERVERRAEAVTQGPSTR